MSTPVPTQQRRLRQTYGPGDGIWPGWVRMNKYIGTMTMANTTNVVWRKWVEPGTLGSLNYVPISPTQYTLTNEVWTGWNHAYEMKYVLANDVQTMRAIARPFVEPAEVQAEREQRRREAAAKRVAAQQRAAMLLEAMLSPEQVANYRRTQSFVVVGSRGNRYRLTLGRAHNVFLLDEHGKKAVELCAHVRDNIPDEDNLVAQKLMLECDEDAYLRVANAWDLRWMRRSTLTQSGLRLITGERAA